jgi:DNA polymerase-1
MKDRVMIIDALNMFLRAYIVDPSLSMNGDPIGGIKGSMKILQKMIRMIQPSQIVIVWDGPNGSRKRKQINSNYKEGRAPIRLNRNVNNLTDDEQMINKVWQQGKTIEYFNEMPIIQLCIPEIEADDVISYLIGCSHYDGWQKVIVSNDKDFLQLCDDYTLVYRPVKDEFVSRDKVVDEYGIHPTNMALARALIGDNSDNLPGIRGLGFKTVAKNFPYLKESKTYFLSNIVDTCEKKKRKLKVDERIIEGQDRVAENYKLMQLYSPTMSLQSKQKVDWNLANFKHEFSYIDILKMMRQDGFGELNWSDMKIYFDKMVKLNK